MKDRLAEIRAAYTNWKFPYDVTDELEHGGFPYPIIGQLIDLAEAIADAVEEPAGRTDWTEIRKALHRLTA